MEIKKTAEIAMLLALSVVLNIMESFIPITSLNIPGVKIGLANTVIVFAIYKYTFKDVLFISIARVFLTGLLRTGIFSISFFFSLGGGVLSVILMMLVKKYTNLSLIGVSVVGALTHSVGQVLVGILFLRISELIYYLPWLLLLSIPTGIVVGKVVKTVLNYYNVKYV